MYSLHLQTEQPFVVGFSKHLHLLMCCCSTSTGSRLELCRSRVVNVLGVINLRDTKAQTSCHKGTMWRDQQGLRAILKSWGIPELDREILWPFKILSWLCLIVSSMYRRLAARPALGFFRRKKSHTVKIKDSMSVEVLSRPGQHLLMPIWIQDCKNQSSCHHRFNLLWCVCTQK